AHRRQRIAGLEDAVEHHADDAVLELAVNGCVVVPGNCTHLSLLASASAERMKRKASTIADGWPDRAGGPPGRHRPAGRPRPWRPGACHWRPAASRWHN